MHSDDAIDQAAKALPPDLDAVRRLGEGSTAVVWLARDRRLKRLVAVKILRHALAQDSACCSRFEREAQAAARLDHPSITTIYDTGRLADGRPYIVMQYVEGRTLEDIISSGERMSATRALCLLADVFGALHEAHQRNIVHRDIRPANILVDEASGRAIVTDFGVAAILVTGSEAVTKLTREGDTIGDPSYNSPESLQGMQLTGAADIYAAGVVAFELLTGSGPFEVSSQADAIRAHLRRPVPELATLCPEIPLPVAALLQRCLAKQPGRRPTAAEVSDGLSDPDKLAQAQEPSAGGFFRQLQRRKVYRAAAAYVAAVFLLLQVLDLLVPAIEGGDAIYRAVVLVAIAGLPLAVAAAWFYDIRNWRLIRAREESVSSVPARTAAWVGLAVITIFSLMLAAWFLI